MNGWRQCTCTFIYLQEGVYIRGNDKATWSWKWDVTYACISPFMAHLLLKTSICTWLLIKTLVPLLPSNVYSLLISLRQETRASGLFIIDRQLHANDMLMQISCMQFLCPLGDYLGAMTMGYHVAKDVCQDAHIHGIMQCWGSMSCVGALILH